jgi:uroporphyrin-III C-methyltransferase
VSGALLVLQDAEARLKATDGASLSSLRRLLLRDIDRLKALPSTDVVSVLLRLDNVLQAVDTLPLLASFSPGALPAQPPLARGTAKPGEATGRAEGDAGSPVSSWSWLGESSMRTLASLRSELQSLVRVNRVDMPEAVLLAPEQSYFVRENLRLQLLNARAALLARQDSVFRGDIERSQKWITTYFDSRQISVSNAAAQLRQLQSSRVSVELPSLAETLSAVRALRTGRAP